MRPVNVLLLTALVFIGGSCLLALYVAFTAFLTLSETLFILLYVGFGVILISGISYLYSVLREN